MGEIKYRQAKNEDLLAIIELWKEFIDFQKVRDSFFSRSEEGPEKFCKFIAGNIRKDDAGVYVAEKDGEVIAHILASIQNYPPSLKLRDMD